MIKRIGFLTGCGKGIGFSIAKKILMNEANTLLFGVSRSFTEDVKALINLYPHRFYFKEADISDIQSINSILEEIYSEHGRIDFAICNAGKRSRSLVKDSSLDLYNSIFAVNTLANINIVKFLITSNIRYNKKLNILLLSSIVGGRGFEGLSSYAVSKSALEGFMKSVAVEYGKNNIQINCIAPGFIESSYAKEFKSTNNDLYNWTIDQTPMGRWGTCDEIAELSLFAVSEKNSYMTGSVMYCDGGWTAK